jgi:hypothetical protein
MIKRPQRVYNTFSPNHPQWEALIQSHSARTLQNGESPQDFPNEAVAYETLNFGWILSRPDIHGKRAILVQF